MYYTHQLLERHSDIENDVGGTPSRPAVQHLKLTKWPIQSSEIINLETSASNPNRLPERACDGDNAEGVFCVIPPPKDGLHGQWKNTAKNNYSAPQYGGTLFANWISTR